MRRGWTLVELLAVLAIVAVLCAILWPVAASAKQSAKVASSVSRLRQIHLAAVLYQQDWGARHDYGTAEDMGLPSLSQIGENRLGLSLEFWHSPCSDTRPSDPRLDYTWAPDEVEEWVEFVSRLKEKALLSTDMTCNERDLPADSRWVRRRGLGVTFGGSLIRRFRDGDFRDPQWWSDAPL